jgi:apolipoprotein N-acyltransferase
MKMNLILCGIAGTVCALAFTDPRLCFLVFPGFVLLFCAVLRTEKLTKKLMMAYNALFFGLYYAVNFFWVFSLRDFVRAEPLAAAALLGAGLLFIIVLMTGFMCVPLIFYPVVRRGSILDAVLFSVLYIFGEWLQGVFYPLAFPWVRVSVIAAPMTCFIQSASLLGSLFVSLIILLICGFTAYAIVKRCKKALIPAMSILTLNLVFGIAYMNIPPAGTSEEISACIVQGNMPKDEKWTMTRDDVFNLYFDTAAAHMTDSADVIVFPETAFPFRLLDDPQIMSKVREFAEKNNVTLIVGMLYEEGEDTYNSVAAVTPDGNCSEIYSKQMLVPIGEMLPFENVLSGIYEALSVDISPFTRGDEYVLIETPSAKFGTAICYESVFPQVSRENVRIGAEILLVPSNDSWFGTSHAVSQHHTHSLMRAAENGRFVLRASNCAVSSVISPRGEVIITAPKYELTAINAEVTPVSKRTPYSFAGDIIILSVLPVPVLIFRKKFRLRKKERSV